MGQRCSNSTINPTSIDDDFQNASKLYNSDYPIPEIIQPHQVIHDDINEISKACRFFIHIWGIRLRGIHKNKSCFVVINWDDYSFEKKTTIRTASDSHKFSDNFQFIWTASSLGALKQKNVVINIYETNTAKKEEEKKKKCYLIGSCVINIMDIATGPIQYDLPFTLKKKKSFFPLKKYGPSLRTSPDKSIKRIMLYIQMNQICSLIINPVHAKVLTICDTGKEEPTLHASLIETTPIENPSDFPSKDSREGREEGVDDDDEGDDGNNTNNIYVEDISETNAVTASEWKLFFEPSGLENREVLFESEWSERSMIPVWDTLNRNMLLLHTRKQLIQPETPCVPWDIATPTLSKEENDFSITEEESDKNRIIVSSNTNFQPKCTLSFVDKVDETSEESYPTRGNILQRLDPWRKRLKGEKMEIVVTDVSSSHSPEDPSPSLHYEPEEGISHKTSFLDIPSNSASTENAEAEGDNEPSLHCLDTALHTLEKICKEEKLLAKSFLSPLLPTIRLESTLDLLRMHHLQIRVVRRALKKEQPKFFGEVWLPFLKIYDQIPIEDINKMFFHQKFTEKIWRNGKVVGTLELVLILQNNLILYQSVAGVFTENGKKRVNPSVLGSVGRPIRFLFRNASIVPYPINQIAYLHQVLLDYLYQKNDMESSMDSKKKKTFRKKLWNNLISGSDASDSAGSGVMEEAAGAMGTGATGNGGKGVSPRNAEVASGGDDLAESNGIDDENQENDQNSAFDELILLLRSTHMNDNRKLFYYSSHEAILSGQKVLLNLANHLLEYLDAVPLKVREKYFILLHLILKRGELEAAYSLPEVPPILRKLPIDHIHALYKSIKHKKKEKKRIQQYYCLFKCFSNRAPVSPNNTDAASSSYQTREGTINRLVEDKVNAFLLTNAGDSPNMRISSTVENSPHESPTNAEKPVVIPLISSLSPSEPFTQKEKTRLSVSVKREPIEESSLSRGVVGNKEGVEKSINEAERDMDHIDPHKGELEKEKLRSSHDSVPYYSSMVLYNEEGKVDHDSRFICLGELADVNPSPIATTPSVQTPSVGSVPDLNYYESIMTENDWMELVTYHKRMKLCRQYFLLLYRLLYYSLDQLSYDEIFEGLKKYVSIFLCIIYFRIPAFREELLEEIITKEETQIVFSEWRGLEFILEDPLHKISKTLKPHNSHNQSEKAHSNPMMNSELKSLQDWHLFHTSLWSYFSKGILLNLMKYELSPPQSSLWKVRLKKRSFAFFSFTEQWIKYLYQVCNRKKNIRWQMIPGFSLLLKAFLIELKNRDVVSYPDSLLDCSGTLLVNERLLSIFIKVIFFKTNVHDTNAVCSVFSYIDYWLQVLLLRHQKLPTNFDYLFFFHAIDIVLQSEISINLIKVISFLYKNLYFFNNIPLRLLLDKIIIEKHFFQLFFHWNNIVRKSFYTLLFYRISEGSRLAMMKSTTHDPNLIQDDYTLLLSYAKISILLENMKFPLVFPKSVVEASLSKFDDKRHKILPQIKLTTSDNLLLLDPLIPSNYYVAASENNSSPHDGDSNEENNPNEQNSTLNQSTAAVTPGSTNGKGNSSPKKNFKFIFDNISPSRILENPKAFIANVVPYTLSYLDNTHHTNVSSIPYSKLALTEYINELMKYREWVIGGATNLPTLQVPSTPLDFSIDIPLENW